MADYIDLDYSMEPNIYGTMDYKEDAEAIKQSMIDILLTKRGEREFMPDYGSRLYYILMEKMNELTAMELRDEIRVSLENWEPRIRITEIEIVSYPDNNYYEVTIHFDLIRLSQNEILSLQLNRIS